MFISLVDFNLVLLLLHFKDPAATGGIFHPQVVGQR